MQVRVSGRVRCRDVLQESCVMCLRNPATYISIVTRYLTDTTERVIAGARKSARARARERKVKERRAEEGVCVCVIILMNLEGCFGIQRI